MCYLLNVYRQKDVNRKYFTTGIVNTAGNVVEVFVFSNIVNAKNYNKCHGARKCDL